MAKTIEDLFILLATFSDLLPILLFLFQFKTLKQEDGIRIITLGCLILFLLNGLNYFATAGVKNVIYPLFTLIEFVFFAFFLWLHIKNQRVKAAIVIAAILFLIFVLIEFIFVPFRGIDSVPIGVESLVILIFSFYYLYEQMNDVSDQFIYNKYHFWIVVGLMIYLAGSFFIYVFATQVDKSILLQWWMITVILYIIKNVFFVIGISMFIRQRKDPPRSAYHYSPYLN